tara:strand:- start:1994 stop:3112 length:1119 start_codon:yes stop_codon:yes gene_type:complete
MNIDIDKNFDQLLKDKQIEYDQKQYDLVKVLAQKNKIFHKFTYKSSILEKLRISKRTPPKGMYIYGQVGRGKSMLMDLFFDSINIKEKRRVHFNEFMNEVHEEIFKWREKNKLQPSKEEDKDPILMVAKLVKKQCKLLCFDEFQVEDIADAMILGRLFKILFDMKILIIATSNIHPSDLYSEGLNRDTFLPFIDILEENMEIYHLDAEKDYRIDRLRDQTVYFSPNNKINRINYNEAWQKLKGSIEVINKILKVKGRDLIIPNSAGKYVKFTYDELCIKPLGVADYLEISKNFNVIFISEIPKMNVKKRNEIKRFINLVDTLYEARSILFILADSPAKDLLDGGKDAKIFQRTVSRLEEMQSADYLNNIIKQ